MGRDEFNVLYAIKKYGISSFSNAEWLSEEDDHYIRKIYSYLLKVNFVDLDGITEKGLLALKSFKVDNAIIMAAGISSRFVPLSLEKPKGLLSVKGEILIERQIQQLISTGIKSIIIVVGYKSKEFYYLKEKYADINVVFIENPEYATKNNSHTLFLAQKYLRNTYICSSDNYFMKNPFDEYVYESYYSAVHITSSSDEWYMKKDNDFHIVDIQIGGKEGEIMLGHAYFDHNFSNRIIEYLNNDQNGHYDNSLWETILKEHIHDLPPMAVKLYPKNIIFEFDSLDELRQFDLEYINNSQSKILQRICLVFGCNESEVSKFKNIYFSDNKYSFSFEIEKVVYVYSFFNSDKDLITSLDNKLKIEVPSWESEQNLNIYRHN